MAASMLDDWWQSDPDGLRWYQREAFDAIMAGFQTFRSQMIVMATGTGKTQTFGAIAKHWPGSVLIIAHRDELVDQARERLEQMTGEYVEIEQGGLRCNPSTRIVIGSAQTLAKQNRLEALGKDRFSLIIPDEFHHYVSPTWRRPLEYFNAKILGVTATPDRADEKALGQIAENVAYIMDVVDGIEQGYLVPIRGRQVILENIELDGVKTAKGDFVATQLDEAMVKAVEGIVAGVLKYEPDRQAVCFFPGVKSAELAAHRFNTLKPGSACFISAKTPPDERKQMVRDFKAGRYIYLCNCMIAIEGFDAPQADLIVMGRPTKSRSLYAQMVGRGTRVLPGLVEHYEGGELSEVRRQKVTQSAKPDLVVLDFVGNSTKHTLMTPVDLLGGNYSEDEVTKAKELEKDNPGQDAKALLETARREIVALAQAVRSQVKATVRSFDPFGVLNSRVDEEERYVTRFGQQSATDGQFRALVDFGLEKREIEGLTKHAAHKLLGSLIARSKLHLATYRQLCELKRFGVTKVNMSKARASEAIGYIRSKNSSHIEVDPAHLDGIINRRREVGEEG
jgi:superfamily II DNA or RNA helicase